MYFFCYKKHPYHHGCLLQLTDLKHEVGMQDYFLVLFERFRVSILDLGQSVGVNAMLTNHFVFCFTEEQ